jgi:virginiamycin B lyase
MLKNVLLPVALMGSILLAQGQGTAPGPKMPDGPAKALVEGACAECHSLSLVLPGHTPGDWKLLVERMFSVGARIQDDQIGLVADYLAKNFPEKDIPKGIVIPGNAKVTFKEWDVPTRGARPHDPLAAPDGTIWYTGHYANLLGHLNPKTGEIKEYHPPLDHSGPHGLVMDKDGKIWFTGNFKGYIGKLDPKTGEFSEYKLPAEASDPHTPIFDQKGTLWFSVQRSNLIGRLIPATGEIKMAKVPTPKALPYGMVVDTKGTLWCVEFGAPKIVSIDPNTMAMKEYPLLHAESRPRRIAISSDDIIYYADYSLGYLGRLEPKTGKVTEWPSPSGTRSMPYGISVISGIVWYSESGTSPNTLVRFDPQTAKFQTWAIPNGGGVVRNMMATKDGNLAMALSGINKIALAAIAK